MTAPADNIIHPTAIVEGDVILGKNNTIHPYTVLYGPLEIGDNNQIGPNVAIGTPGQNTRDPRYDLTGKRIKIGSNNIIREFSAVQKPCFTDLTSIGSDIFIMQSVHVPHDALIEDQVTLTPMVALAGSAAILRGAVLSLGVTVHQGTVIGQYSMIAMNTPVVRNVRPFSKVIWGKAIAVNDYAIEKFGYSAHSQEIREYVLHNQPPSAAPIVEIVEHYEKLHQASKRKQLMP